MASQFVLESEKARKSRAKVDVDVEGIKAGEKQKERGREAAGWGEGVAWKEESRLQGLRSTTSISIKSLGLQTRQLPRRPALFPPSPFLI